MDADDDKIDDAVLALLWLTLHNECRAWKGMDWSALDRLYEKALIHNPARRVSQPVAVGQLGGRAAMLIE